MSHTVYSGFVVRAMCPLTQLLCKFNCTVNAVGLPTKLLCSFTDVVSFIQEAIALSVSTEKNSFRRFCS